MHRTGTKSVKHIYPFSRCIWNVLIGKMSASHAFLLNKAAKQNLFQSVYIFLFVNDCVMLRPGRKKSEWQIFGIHVFACVAFPCVAKSARMQMQGGNRGERESESRGSGSPIRSDFDFVKNPTGNVLKASHRSRKHNFSVAVSVCASVMQHEMDSIPHVESGATVHEFGFFFKC